MIATSASRDTLPRVAYQGVPGAFGEQAVIAHWNGLAIPTPTRSFERTLIALDRGQVDLAVIPTWNSSIGPIVGGQNALESAGDALEVVTTVEIPIRHSLWALRPLALRDVRIVGSHPAALAQCSRFLQSHPWIVPYTVYDTASAARDLRDSETWFRRAGGDASRCTAISSDSAGRRYDLARLAENIQDDPDNRTRFAVVRWRQNVIPRYARDDGPA